MSNNLITSSKETLLPKVLSPLKSLQSQVDELFDSFLDGFRDDFTLRSDFGKTFQPKVNISEDEKAYHIEAQLAGVNKEDVKVQCDNGILQIKAEKKAEKTQEKKNYHRLEYSFGSYSRSFALPGNADSDNIDAQMKDGILKITLPKSANRNPASKEIKIR
jgi:HSP20 family protein